MSELIDRERFSADMRDFQNRVGIWRDEAEDTETWTRADAALATIIETKLILDKQPTIAALRWHRVEEPPKEYGTYIVRWKDGEKFWWEKADWDEDWCTEEPNWYSYRDGRATIIKPDYWMPIEPPKEGE